MSEIIHKLVNSSKRCEWYQYLMCDDTQLSLINPKHQNQKNPGSLKWSFHWNGVTCPHCIGRRRGNVEKYKEEIKAQKSLKKFNLSAGEFIKHAAVSAPSGRLYLGKSHAECFKIAGKFEDQMSSAARNQGFMTTRDRFVDRFEAAAIAFKAGQITNKVEILFSENLWSPREDGLCNYDPVNGYTLKPRKLYDTTTRSRT